MGNRALNTDHNTASIQSAVFIARQHAQRDIVLPFLCVRLSVHPMPVLCLKECTYIVTLFNILVLPSLRYLSQTAITKFQREPP